MQVDGRKLSHAKLEEIRFQAVWRVLAGETPTAVANDMGLYKNRVFIWLAAYRAGGWHALRSRKAMGRPTRLTVHQLRWIREMLTAKSPQECRLPMALWTRAQIGTLIAQRFSVRLSPASIGRLLAQLGLSCQRPLLRAQQHNHALVEHWLKAEYPKIRAQAKRDKAKIFFESETCVPLTLTEERIRKPSGKIPVARLTGQRSSVHMMSAVSPRGELRFMVVRTNVSARVFIAFLKRLVQGQRRPVYLIVDGPPSRQSKEVKAYVESLHGSLRLFFLPPYSAELNVSSSPLMISSPQTVPRAYWAWGD